MLTNIDSLIDFLEFVRSEAKDNSDDFLISRACSTDIANPDNDQAHICHWFEASKLKTIGKSCNTCIFNDRGTIKDTVNELKAMKLLGGDNAKGKSNP